MQWVNNAVNNYRKTRISSKFRLYKIVLYLKTKVMAKMFNVSCDAISFTDVFKLYVFTKTAQHSLSIWN